MLKLSKAGKMPCRSWSLQALETCPGSIGNDGELVDACKGCYATAGNYRFPNVKAPREHNKEDWKRNKWVSDMVQELDNDRYFRWFDSGDVYDIRLARKILEVMKLTPWCNHWLPTRMYKFKKFSSVFKEMEKLPNVVVRFSSDSVSGETVKGKNTSTIIPTSQDAKASMTICEAYQREGKCGTCRACWNKKVKVIAYPAHGKSMVKLIKTLLIAA
tara:strand:+ start:3146 stop:3793 length:648 start_codon:yes stop_codon:yes gene_type:complete